ncbi:MAG: hypothetical protein ABJG88_09355, partial [Litorimonas sp.]
LMKNHIHNVFKVSFIGLMLSLSACNQTSSEYDELLNVEQPFGFSWDAVFEPDETLKNSCAFKFLDKFFLDSEITTIQKSCLSESRDWSYFPKEEIPLPSKNGELSFVAQGSGEPLLYTYSYLHELFPTEETRKKKLLHAQRLKKVLSKKYGKPDMEGDFYNKDSSQAKFIKSKTERPCAFWVVDDFGILLCSERVIFGDGFEMGLDFFNLKRSSHGAALRDIALQQTEHHESMNDAAQKTPVKSALDDLNDWLNPSFGRCDSEELEPLEKVLGISSAEKQKLHGILSKYHGQSLAEYAIEFGSNYTPDELKKKHDKTLMYLLKTAADQGSARAMNEIGASLVYCYQGVQRDTALGKEWIDKATAGGSVVALKTQAYLHYSMTDEIVSKDNFVTLLKQCSEIDEDVCGKELKAFLEISEIVAK